MMMGFPGTRPLDKENTIIIPVTMLGIKAKTSGLNILEMF